MNAAHFPERSEAKHPFRSVLRRCFAWGMARSKGHMDRVYGTRKRELLGSAHGTVVEIGAGAGSNLEYYPRGASVIAVEPNRYMHRYLMAEAQRADIPVEVCDAVGERIDLDDACADVVVSTLVLCSVENPLKVVSEIRRILKPGGRFLFLEHVAAPAGTGLRRAQVCVKPIWQRRLRDAGLRTLSGNHPIHADRCAAHRGSSGQVE
ncbi:MAG: class I SAM-dependent methyltransferase [Candidatus Hydrogenedentes bacterium]|nr:class I SAM-dependent methyltransferase [Candidatus Hydrogenedentota bacterium]